MKDFKGKVAVITGAGRGIGRGIALRCAKEGMKIVLAGIGMESLTKTETDLKAMGAETLIVQTDVSLLEDIENLVNKSYEAFGEVHLLVNNAGVIVLGDGSVLGCNMDDWDWVMDVNFYGVLHSVRAFIPRMMEQDSECHVVNVSSSAGVVTAWGSYGVSKHAVVALTESLYSELGESKVNVSVYCPDRVHTEIDTIERSRPERFKNEPPSKPITEEQKAFFREKTETGLSIDESANFVFDGLQANRLYIGPKAFQHVKEDFLEQILNRAENIINERNPE